jgi:hypothetical protein
MTADITKTADSIVATGRDVGGCCTKTFAAALKNITNTLTSGTGCRQKTDK